MTATSAAKVAPTTDDVVASLSKELATLEDRSKRLRSDVSALLVAKRARELNSGAPPNYADPMPGDEGTAVPAHVWIAPSMHPALEAMYEDVHKRISDIRTLAAEFETQQSVVHTHHKRIGELRETKAMLHRCLEEMQSAARWTPGSKTSRECPISLKDELACAKKKVLELYEDRSTVQAEIEAQTSHMMELMTKIEQRAALKEEQLQRRAEVAGLEHKLSAVTAEIATCERLLKRKEKLYETTKQRSAEAHNLSALEVAKRTAHSQLQTRKEQARINDAAVRHRATTIAVLLNRLELIGNALEGGSNEGAANEASGALVAPASLRERVDVEVVEGLRHETDFLYRQWSENTVRLHALDSDIDDLHGRIRTLEKATRVTEEEEKRLQRDHDRYMNVVHEQLAQQRSEAQEFLTKLQQEIGSLRERSGSQ